MRVLAVGCTEVGRMICWPMKRLAGETWALGSTCCLGWLWVKRQVRVSDLRCATFFVGQGVECRAVFT